LNIYRSTLVSSSIDEFWVLYHQVYILSKIYKGADLISLLTGFSLIHTSLTNNIRCRPKWTWVRLVNIWLVFNQYLRSFAWSIRTEISKVIETCIFNCNRLGLTDEYILRELFCIVKLKEATVDYYTSSWIHYLYGVLGGPISKE
jgi:hypothetical protein